MRLLVIAIAVVVAIITFRASIRTGLVVLVATVLFIPSLLVVPGAGTSIVTVQRIAMVALLLNLVRRVRASELPGRIFEVTPIHAVFLLFLATSFVLGVGLAQPLVSITDASHVWANFLDEFVFFVVALAAIRAIGDIRFIIRAFAALLVTSAVIAVGEHATGQSWARMFFSGADKGATTASAALQQRGDQTRVRVASGFSLAYAWLAVSFVPLLLVAAVRTLRRWWLVVPGLALVVVAVYWTHSRSAALPLVVAVVALAALARDRRLAAVSAGAAVLMLLAYFSSASIANNLSVAIDQGSVDVRFQRIPAITSFVATHALTGLGLTGVADLGFSAVDSAYLLVYGDIGIIGLTMLVLLYATIIAVVGRGLFATDLDQRLIAAASLLGVVTLIGAGFLYDAITQLDDQRILYLLAALGVVVAEQSVGAPRWFAIPTPSRITAIAIAIGGGILVNVAAPTHVAQTFAFTTLSPYTQVVNSPDNTGRTLIGTVCNTVAVGQFARGSTQLTCRDPNEGQEQQLAVAGPGQGELRVQAPDITTARATLLDLVRTVRAIPRMENFRLTAATTGPVSGKATAARTAPVWLPMLVGFAALMLPGEPRKRRRRDEPPARASTPEPALSPH
ncbi:MAG: hypothetical protein QOG53_1707 [Frankiales bacterium]|jgi:hypothetical protein|nr:hypothetical protein [Frankiales bacterium]